MQPPKKAGFSPGAPEAQRGIAPLHDFRHSRPCHQLWPRPARQPPPAASYLLPATRSFLVKLFTPLTKVFGNKTRDTHVRVMYYLKYGNAAHTSSRNHSLLRSATRL